MAKHSHLVLSAEERLALKMLATANDLTMSRMAAKLIMQAYENQEFSLPPKKMSKIKKLVKKWA